jgi:hypothetical protein
LQAASYWYEQEKNEHAENVVTAEKRDKIDSGWSEEARSLQRREFRSSQSSSGDDTACEKEKAEDMSE